MSEDVYTHGHHDSVLRSHRQRTAENSAAYLLPHLETGHDILDVGCGPASLTCDLASHVQPGTMIGLDRDVSVLREARSVAEARRQGNAAFHAGDVYQLAFDDDSFDVVHAHQLLQHLSDPVHALIEMKRVARPGGLIAARDGDYAAMTWHPPDERLDHWLNVYRAVAKSNHAEPDAGRQLLAWALQAGYSSVEPSASVWCFADQQSLSWWGGLWAERMTQSAVARQAIERGFATRQTLRDIAAGFEAWATRPGAWFSVLHGEILAVP